MKEPKACNRPTLLENSGEFKMQSIKETKTIKSYADWLMSIAIKEQLVGKPFLDEKILQKVLVTVPKKMSKNLSFGGGERLLSP